jgi:sec-independent protein translocase protein TatC
MTEQNLENGLLSMSLGDHLEELRGRLLLAIAGLGAGFVVCLFFGKRLMRLISVPLEQATARAGVDMELQAIHPSEAFLVYLKTSLLFGLIISCPWVFYHLWKFVSAGLYRHERKLVYYIVPVSAFLFITGTVFFIIVVAPLVMTFFIKFDPGVYVERNFTFQSYVNMILVLTFVFGAAFQMPIFIIALERMGLVSIERLRSSRKIVIMALVVISAMATPPDVISQISLAVPLYGLYEGSLLFIKFKGRKRKD